MTITVGYAGLTHLGLNSSVAAALGGHNVVAFDPDTHLTDELRAGRTAVSEPGLREGMREAASRLEFTSDSAALGTCDLVYVAPDVPTDDLGQSDTRLVDAMLKVTLANCGPHVPVVVLSQVTPGFTRERGTGRPNFFYQVETLIFGRAMERATRPERIIVGCAEPDQILPDVFREFLDSFGCPVLPMRYESAELAKIAINCMLVASVSAANSLAEVCEAIGADWSEIVPALRLDRRIGPYAYINAGLGISGGNLERDMASVLSMASAHSTDGGVVAAWRENSRRRKDWAADVMERELAGRIEGTVVAVLGLAYKENTHSVKNSPALVLIERLVAAGASIRAFDPVVSEIENPQVAIAESAFEALEGADAVAIMTPWPEFDAISVADFAQHLAGRLLVDPYGIVSGTGAVAAGFDYIRLGVPPVRGAAD